MNQQTNETRPRVHSWEYERGHRYAPEYDAAWLAYVEKRRRRERRREALIDVLGLLAIAAAVLGLMWMSSRGML